MELAFTPHEMEAEPAAIHKPGYAYLWLHEGS
jgi:hypothetical protein